MTLLIRHNITALHSTASCLKKVSGNKANLWGKWLLKFTSRFLDIISNWSWVLCERCSWHLNGIKRGTQGRSGEEIFKLPIVKQMTAWLKLGSLLMQSSFSPSFFAWDPISHEKQNSTLEKEIFQYPDAIESLGRSEVPPTLATLPVSNSFWKLEVGSSNLKFYSSCTAMSLDKFRSSSQFGIHGPFRSVFLTNFAPFWQ